MFEDRRPGKLQGEQVTWHAPREEVWVIRLTPAQEAAAMVCVASPCALYLSSTQQPRFPSTPRRRGKSQRDTLGMHLGRNHS